MNDPCAFEWEHFSPADEAVLCFVRRGDEVLLIEKLRGLGAGKVNAPGGKLEPHEPARDAAIRETMEEVGIVPRDPDYRGSHRFAFTDGYHLLVHVYIAERWDGHPRPSPEAIPFWCAVDSIPYERMWQDDRHWLPEVLDGATVDSRMVFDGDTMTCWEIAFDGRSVKSGPHPPLGPEQTAGR